MPLTKDERDELLRWADHVDVLVRFCSVHMPHDRVDQYRAGASAFWAMCHRIAGNDATADKLAADVPAEVVPPPPDHLALFRSRNSGS